MTNRTLLWKYYDTEACLRFHKRIGIRYGGPKGCYKTKNVNSKKDCDKALALAPWLPSYDDWSERLNFPEPVFLYGDVPAVIANATSPFNYNNENLDGPINGHRIPIVSFPRTWMRLDWKRTGLVGWSDGALLDKLPAGHTRQVTADLMSMGLPFAYGMLTRYLFDFSRAVKDSIAALRQAYQSEGERPSYDIVLHSRHSNNTDDGCDLSDELRCLEQVLRIKSSSESCSVYVLTDRACTISAFEKWGTASPGGDENSERNVHQCSVRVADHTGAVQGPKDEHGPFAGKCYTRFRSNLAAGVR